MELLLRFRALSANFSARQFPRTGSVPHVVSQYVTVSSEWSQGKYGCVVVSPRVCSLLCTAMHRLRTVSRSTPYAMPSETIHDALYWLMKFQIDAHATATLGESPSKMGVSFQLVTDCFAPISVLWMLLLLSTKSFIVVMWTGSLIVFLLRSPSKGTLVFSLNQVTWFDLARQNSKLYALRYVSNVL